MFKEFEINLKILSQSIHFLGNFLCRFPLKHCCICHPLYFHQTHWGRLHNCFEEDLEEADSDYLSNRNCSLSIRVLLGRSYVVLTFITGSKKPILAADFDRFINCSKFIFGNGVVKASSSYRLRLSPVLSALFVDEV